MGRFEAGGRKGGDEVVAPVPEEGSPSAEGTMPDSVAEQVATFRELYRSRDGRITVFEDADGHLTAVDSSRLVTTGAAGSTSAR